MKLTPAVLSLVLGLVAVAMPARAQDPAEAIVSHHRANYPQPLTHADAAKLLHDIAADLARRPETGAMQWGLLRKTSGNRCPLAGAEYACDIICELQPSGNEARHWDVFVDGPGTAPDGTLVPGAATPAWQDKGPIDPSRCEVVIPAKPPPSPPYTDLLHRVVRLEEEIGTFSDGVTFLLGKEHELKAKWANHEDRIGRLEALEALIGGIERLAARVQALEEKPPPPFPCSTARVFLFFRYFTIRSCPEGQP